MIQQNDAHSLPYDTTFVLCADDIRALDFRAAEPYKRAAIRRPLIVLALLPVIITAVFFLSPAQGDSFLTLLSKAAPMLVGVPVLIAVVFGVWWAMLFWNARPSQYTQERLTATLPHFGEEQSVSLTAEGVHLKDAAGESATAWQSVKVLQEDEERIYLLYKNGTISVIPKRAFADTSAMTQFCAFARGNIN